MRSRARVRAWGACERVWETHRCINGGRVGGIKKQHLPSQPTQQDRRGACRVPLAAQNGPALRRHAVPNGAETQIGPGAPARPQRRERAPCGALHRPPAPRRLRANPPPVSETGQRGHGEHLHSNTPNSLHTHARAHARARRQTAIPLPCLLRSWPRRCPYPEAASRCHSTCTPSPRGARTRTMRRADSPRSSSPSATRGAAC